MISGWFQENRERKSCLKRRFWEGALKKCAENDEKSDAKSAGILGIFSLLADKLIAGKAE